MTKCFVDRCFCSGKLCAKLRCLGSVCSVWGETFDFRTVLVVSQVGEAT